MLKPNVFRKLYERWCKRCILWFFLIEQEGRAPTEILLKLKNDRVRSKQEDKLQDNKLQEEITAGYNCQR
jgi:hypothetical protein